MTTPRCPPPIARPRFGLTVVGLLCFVSFVSSSLRDRKSHGYTKSPWHSRGHTCSELQAQCAVGNSCKTHKKRRELRLYMSASSVPANRSCVFAAGVKLNLSIGGSSSSGVRMPMPLSSWLAWLLLLDPGAGGNGARSG